MITNLKRFSYAPLVMLFFVGLFGNPFSHKPGLSWSMLWGVYVGVAVIVLIDRRRQRRR